MRYGGTQAAGTEEGELGGDKERGGERLMLGNHGDGEEEEEEMGDVRQNK